MFWKTVFCVDFGFDSLLKIEIQQFSVFAERFGITRKLFCTFFLCPTTFFDRKNEINCHSMKNWWI